MMGETDMYEMGWDDDDDIDLDDVEIEDEDAEATDSHLDSGTAQVPNHASTQQPPRPPQQAAISIGQGLFLGRLTRFIEAVTQPDNEDEQPMTDAPESSLSHYLVRDNNKSGWDHDDSELLDDDDREPSGWQDDTLDELDVYSEPVLNAVDADVHSSMSPRQDHLLLEKSNEEPPASAWGDDDDALDGLDDDDYDENEIVDLEQTTGDVTLESLQPESMLPRLEVPQHESRTAPTGWEEEETLDETLESLHEESQLHSSGMEHATQGWAHDDLEGLEDENLEGLDEEAFPLQVDATESQTEGVQGGSAWDKGNNDLEGLDDNFHGPLGVVCDSLEVQANVDDDDGWEEDELEGLDDNDDEHIGSDHEFQPLNVSKPAGGTASIATTETFFDAIQTDEDIEQLEEGRKEVSQSVTDTLTEGLAVEDSGKLEMSGSDREDLAVLEAGLRDDVHASTNEATLDSISVECVSEGFAESGWDDDGLDALDTEVADDLPDAEPPTESKQMPHEPDSRESEDALLDIGVADGEGTHSVVVDHVPPDSPKMQHHDSTLANAGIQSNEATPDDAWSDDLDPEKEEFGPVVDHTPLLSSLHVLARSTSLAVQAPLDESEDDDVDGSVEGLASTSKSTDMAPVACNEGDVSPELVDHVPSDVPRIRSQDSTVTTAGLRSSVDTPDDAWNDDLDPEKEEFGPVVDHTPLISPSLHRLAHSTSMAVQAPLEELEQDEDATSVEDVASPSEFTDEASIATEKGSIDAVVVDHVPSDARRIQRQDSTFATAGLRSRSATPDDTCDDDLDPEREEFGPIVDHTPLLSPPLRVLARSASLAVQAPLEELDNDDDDGSVEGLASASKATDVTPSEDNTFPVVVDHVPSDASRTPHEASMLTSVGRRSSVDTPDDAWDDELDPEKEEFGLVVDHTPVLSPSPRVLDRSTSMAVQAPLQEMDEDDITADELVSPTKSAEESLIVVDHVPDDIPITSHRDSTKAVVSILSNTLPDDVWENDLDPSPDDFGPVVDHTPSVQQSEWSSRNLSVAVQAPKKDVDEEDEVFGLVVDHTPSVPPSTNASLAGSMAVLAPLPEPDDELEEAADALVEPVDENRREVWEDEDDTSTVLMEQLSHGRKEEPMVDHVPRRTESRPTDASTLVLVDPSEVSTVGDMTYEEQEYGPVVDHTPPPRPIPSIAGSTIVATNISVYPDDSVVDDLDDEVEGDDGHVEHDSNEDDVDTIPTIDPPPNGDSNMVDHVPENGNIRRVGSETTLTAANSVLSPDETRFQDFGLVVDHTPVPIPSAPPSRGSLAVQAPNSELDNDDDSSTDMQEATADMPSIAGAEIVVDQLPLHMPCNFHAMNSTAAVNSHRSDDETIEDALQDRYGPVVDHLPNLPASLCPSRGGSTTGALATLSEINDDTVCDPVGDGWDDEDHQDLQSSLNGVTKSFALSPSPASGAKGLSVTFSAENSIERLDMHFNDDAGALAYLAANNETKYYDAEIETEAATGETLYYDPESGETMQLENAETDETNEWDEDMSFLEAEDDLEAKANGNRGNTPDVEAADNGTLERVVVGESLQSNAADSSVQCISCAEAKTGDCPCVQRILQTSSNGDAMVATILTPEGIPVKIDFNKLLQQEITKRLLIEKELEACNSRIESFAREGMLKPENEMLKQANANLSKELESVRESWSNSRIENDELVAKLGAAQDETSGLAVANATFARREAKLEAELEETLNRHKASALEAATVWASERAQLADEIQQLKGVVKHVQTELDNSRTECQSLKVTNEELSCELDKAQKDVSEIRQEREDWDTRRNALDEEISQLKRALETSASAVLCEKSTGDQLRSLQMDAASKSGECEELRSQLAQLHERLKQSEAQNFTHIKESTRLTKQHQNVAADLRKEIAALERRNSDLLATKVAVEAELSEKLREKEAELSELKVTRDSSQIMISELKTNLHESVRKHKIDIQSKLVQIRSLEAKVQVLDKEKIESRATIEHQIQLLRKSESASEDLAALTEERNALQANLLVEKETIRCIQEQLRLLSAASAAANTTNAHTDELVAALCQEKSELEEAVSSIELVVKSLKSDMGAISEDNSSLRLQTQAFENRCHELELAITAMKETFTTDLSEKDAALSSLKSELSSASLARRELQSVCDRFKTRCAEMEVALNSTKDGSNGQSEALKHAKSDLKATKAALHSAMEQVKVVSVERDEWHAKCQDLEVRLEKVKSEASRQLREMEHNVSNRVAKMEVERADLRDQLQQESASRRECDTRIELLESELLSNQENVSEKRALIVRLEGERVAIIEHEREVIAEKDGVVSQCRDLEVELVALRQLQGTLTEDIRRYEENERRLLSDLESLANERDEILKERYALEDENEEMLVQLGLIKQELDAHELERVALHKSIEAKDSALIHVQERLDETEAAVQHLKDANYELPVRGRAQENGGHDSAHMELERMLEEFRHSHSNLERSLQDSSSKNRELLLQIDALRKEKDDVFIRVRELEASRDDVIAETQEMEQNYTARVRDLEQRCRQLDDINKKLQEEIDHIKTHLEQAEASQAHAAHEQIAPFQQRVSLLESACADRDVALREKDSSINELRTRLEQLHSTVPAPEKHESSLERLHTRIEHSEHAATQYLDRLRTLETVLEQTKRELHEKSEKLSTTEVALLNMELDMDVRDQDTDAREEIEARLQDLESCLQKKTHEVRELESQRRKMEMHINALQSDLKKEREDKTSLLAKAENPQVHCASESQELQNLQSHLSALQNQFRSAMSEHDNKENALRSEIGTLNQSIAKKKDQVKRLKQQLQSLSVELSSSQEQLVSKETDFRRLSMELEETRAYHLQSTQKATSQVLDATTKEEAESIDHMRNHIISLAIALERSETQRADAIERLLKERKANADSLRRLGESVKRFYSTLSCGES